MYDGTYLAHYGITGQKWGVRRFQNEDRSLTQAGKERYRVKKTRFQDERGGLTEAGRARVAKTAVNGYLNPSVKDLKRGKATERDKIGKEFSKAYWNAVSKGMSTNAASETDKRLWDRYKEKYASATLKDLKLKNTTKARRDVKRLLSEIDPQYKYDDPAIYDDDRVKKMVAHRKEVEHPHLTRLKKRAAGAKSIIDTAASVKKLVV